MFSCGVSRGALTRDGGLLAAAFVRLGTLAGLDQFGDLRALLSYRQLGKCFE